MGEVITIMNMKGGVGKTTVAMHIAGMVARLHFENGRKRVLIIDYDPQFNLSQSLLPANQYFALEKEKKTTLSILIDDDTKLNPYVLQVPGNHTPPSVKDLSHSVYGPLKSGAVLDIVPSTLDLMYVALGRSDKQVKPMEERFHKFIEECKQLYDLIFIDCHPAGSLFTKTSLVNSDHVLIPVMPQRYAVRGIGLMQRFITAKQVGGNLPGVHILFNATPRTGVTAQEAEIRAHPEFGALCMVNTLKRYKVFGEPEGGRGFVWVSSKPYSTEAYRNLVFVCREFLSRIGIK
ncbi:MAG: ParA family protein [Rhodospirillaceae bacterium]